MDLRTIRVVVRATEPRLTVKLYSRHRHGERAEGPKGGEAGQWTEAALVQQKDYFNSKKKRNNKRELVRSTARETEISKVIRLMCGRKLSERKKGIKAGSKLEYHFHSDRTRLLLFN